MKKFILLIFMFLMLFPLGYKQNNVIATTEINGKLQNKVLVIIFNPYVNGRRVVDYYNWNDPKVLNHEIINTFRQLEGKTLDYKITGTFEVAYFPQKETGFAYDEYSYDACARDINYCYQPDWVDYNKIITEFGICHMVNRGMIDEVWLWGGPWFGFFESAMLGPNPYWINGSAIKNTNCDKNIPIMGFNYESGLENALHSFGHRFEATMEKTYGSWVQLPISHNWNYFGLNDHQYYENDPNRRFATSGCGSVHFPPNGQSHYDYSNTRTVQSYCFQFEKYGSRAISIRSTQPINCTAWECTHLGYMKWWFDSIPTNSGINSDFKYNNWWIYLADVNRAYDNPFVTVTTQPIYIPGPPKPPIE
jgi:hypothetical protein